MTARTVVRVKTSVRRPGRSCQILLDDQVFAVRDADGRTARQAGVDGSPVMSAEIGSLEHRYLRSAIEFAVAIAAEGQRLRPADRLPGGAEAVPHASRGSRARRSAGCAGRSRPTTTSAAGSPPAPLPELVDPIGIEWLRREDGWEERIAELVGGGRATPRRGPTDAAALRRAERRREAAEQAADPHPRRAGRRCRRGSTSCGQQLERRAPAGRGATAASSRTLRAAARRRPRRGRPPRQRPGRGGAGRLAGVEADRDAAIQRGRRRPRPSATRCSPTAPSAAASRCPAPRSSSCASWPGRRAALADRLAGLIEVGTGRPGRPALPGGVARDSRRATEHLLRAPGALVLVDGYNVAKLAWPDDDLAASASRCLDLVDDVARRFGSRRHGRVRRRRRRRRPRHRAGVWPGSCTRRPGVIADDVIRAEVAATPVERPVVVVTNDQAIRRDVAAAGANLVTSDAFLALR